MADKKTTELTLSGELSVVDIFAFVKKNNTTQSPQGSTMGVTFATLVNFISNFLQSPVQNTYANISAMLADQGSQTANFLQYVENATADPEISSGGAYYEYLGTVNGNLTDYTRLTSAEAEVVEETVAFNQFGVKQVSGSLDSAPPQQIWVQTDSGYVVAVLFPIMYSKFLRSFKTLFDSGVSMYLKMYNTTQANVFLDEIQSITNYAEDADYVVVEVSGRVSEDDINPADLVEVFVDIDVAGSDGAPTLDEVTTTGNTSHSDIVVHAEAALIASDDTNPDNYIKIWAEEGYKALIEFFENGYKTTLLANTPNSNRTVRLPNAGGTLPMTINGQTANTDGEMTISAGIETTTEAFTAAFKTDKIYYSTGANEGTQTAVINFTVDDTDAIINGGVVKDITSNGDAWNFSADFGSIATGLTLVDNQIIPDNGVKYRLIGYWNGSKMDVSVLELQTVNFIPQLNAPVVTSVSEGSSAGELDVTFTDTNTSPNETGVAVYYRETSVGGAWTLFGTTAADATSETITGLDNSKEYDVSVIAIGEAAVSNNSDRSNIESATTSDVITPLLIDDLSTISSNWNTVPGTLDELITLTGGKWNITEPATSSGSYYLASNAPLIFSTDTYPLQVWNIKIARPDLAAPCNFNFRICSQANTSRFVLIQTNDSNNTVRVVSNTGGSSTVITSAKLFDGRFKFVLDNGSFEVFIWEGSWTSLATGTYLESVSGNPNLLAQFNLSESYNSYDEGEVTTVEELVVTDVDYATETYAG